MPGTNVCDLDLQALADAIKMAEALGVDELELDAFIKERKCDEE